MSESWQTPESRAIAAEKRLTREQWVAQVAREREEQALPTRLHVHSSNRTPDDAADAQAADAERQGQIIALPETPPAPEGKLEGGRWDWSQWEERDVEDVVLGWAYRTRHAPGPKVAADIQFSLLTQAGVPASSGLLVPVAARKSGIDRILETTHRAHKWAASCILREDDVLSSPTTGDGTAGASLQKLLEDGKDWREDEKAIHGELEYRFKKVFQKWVPLGWLIPEPVVKFSEKDSSGTGRDGLPDNCRLTFRAIDAAEDRIRGTKLAAGYGSRLETSTEHQRQVAKGQAQWFYDEWARGERAGT